MASIEERVTRLEVAQENLVTKADLSKAKRDIIKWIVGGGIGVAILNSSAAIIVLRLIS